MSQDDRGNGSSDEDGSGRVDLGEAAREEGDLRREHHSVTNPGKEHPIEEPRSV